MTSGITLVSGSTVGTVKYAFIYLPKVITIYPMNNQVCSKYVLEVHCLKFLTLFPTEKITKIFLTKVYRRLPRKSQDAKLCKVF